MAGDFCIVLAADATYAPLLRGAIESLECLRGNIEFDLCVLDVGLRTDDLDWLKSRGASIASPDWDIDFPGVNKAPGYFRAMVSRPFLPKYFPDREIYLWMDSDGWLQDPEALRLYVEVARGGRLILASQIDRSYKGHFKRPKLFGWTHNHRSYRLGYGWRVADRYGRNPVLNSGFFAAPAASPHWRLWADALAEGLQRTHDKLIEQTALNLAIYRDRPPVSVAPAYTNWLCDAATPRFAPDTGLLVEPNAPWQPLGFVHLAGDAAMGRAFKVETIDQSTCLDTRLDFESWKSARATVKSDRRLA